MKANFMEVDRYTPYLLSPSVQDWLPEKHLARFVVEIVEQLDLRSLKDSYAGRGSKPYHPEMLDDGLYMKGLRKFLRKMCQGCFLIKKYEITKYVENVSA